MIEWTGWVGSVFAMWGVWLTGRKLRSGFILGIVGCVLWGIKGVATSQLDLITIEVLIILTQIHAWWKWGKDARPTSGNDTDTICE